MFLSCRRNCQNQRFNSPVVGDRLHGPVLDSADVMQVPQRTTLQKIGCIVYKKTQFCGRRIGLGEQVRIPSQAALDNPRLAAAHGAVDAVCIDKKLQGLEPVALFPREENELPIAGPASSQDVDIILACRDRAVLLARIWQQRGLRKNRVLYRAPETCTKLVFGNDKAGWSWSNSIPWVWNNPCRFLHCASPFRSYSARPQSHTYPHGSTSGTAPPRDHRAGMPAVPRTGPHRLLSTAAARPARR